MRKNSIGSIIFDTANAIFMFFMVVVCLYPILHVLFSSLSDETMLMAYNGPLFKPLGFSLNAYKAVLSNEYIMQGYVNTMIVVLGGTAVNILMTALGAYFLSRKDVYLQKYVVFFIIFTMFFNGGLIPTYFNIKGMGMENSLLALIIPTAINTYNLIVMRTGFAAVPDSLSEAAYIDGANDYIILWRVILPLSMPTVAVVALYYVVAHWNEWFNAMLFIRDRELYPLQLHLREILLQNDTESMTTYAAAGEQQSLGETIKNATIIIATVPVLCMYPFIQRFFEKGVMIGAVKG